MLKKRITPEDVVQLLNELLDMDPVAMNKLIEDRVSCNSNVEKHPYVQVNCSDPKDPKVGLLGFLNGLFGTTPTGEGCIVARYTDEDHTQITHFTLNRP